MLEVLLNLLLTAVFVGCGYILGYESGCKEGRKYTIHQLFYGEKDFKRYLDYRRKQIESEDGFWGES